MPSVPTIWTAVAAVAGEGVRGWTTDGAPALDLPAGVATRLAETGAELVFDAGRCTACGGDGFSYRARGDDGRAGVFVWRLRVQFVEGRGSPPCRR